MGELTLSLSETLSLLFSFSALIISSIIAIRGWIRNRNIYDIEHHSFSIYPIEGVDSKDLEDYQEFKKRINSGKYTVIHAYYDQPEYNVLLGRIK